jgi:peroxin-3
MSVSVCGEVSRKYSRGKLSTRYRGSCSWVLRRVSLKSKIGVIELHRLISDVRRRVEHEITFEGNERRIK